MGAKVDGYTYISKWIHECANMDIFPYRGYIYIVSTVIDIRTAIFAEFISPLKPKLSNHE